MERTAMSEDKSLMLIDAVRVALEKATSWQEVKQVRAAAIAAEVYAKQVEAGKDIERKAEQYIKRAERRLGEMIAAGKADGLFKEGGSGSNQYQSIGTVPNENSSRLTLAEAGIDRKLASRAQKLASMPLEEFEEMVQAQKDGKEPSNKKKVKSPPRERDREPLVIDLYNQGLSLKEITAQAGIDSRRVDEIIREEKIRQEERKKLPEILPDMLSKMSDRQKVALAIKQQTEKLEREYRIKVDKEVHRRLELKSDQWQKEQAEAKRVMKGRQGFMTRVIYRKILACLHPDWVTDEKQKRRYEEAFNEFSKLEKCILNEKESPTTFVNFPKTAAEWEELKRKATAERKAAKTNKQSGLAKR